MGGSAFEHRLGGKSISHKPLPNAKDRYEGDESVQSTAMRAVFRVDAFLGDAQALDRPAMDQVLLDDLRCVFGLDSAVPDCFRINNHIWTVLALVEAERLVDAHAAGDACGLGQLLKLCVQLAFAIAGAGWTRRAFGTDIMADENVVLEKGQAGKPPLYKSKRRE